MLTLELDPVVIRQRLSHDPLKVPDPPRRAGALPLLKAGVPAPHGLPPEKVHSAFPVSCPKAHRAATIRLDAVHTAATSLTDPD